MKSLVTLFVSALIYFPAQAKESSPQLEIKINQEQQEIQTQSSYHYNFGGVRVHWSRWADIYLRNTGHEYLPIHNVYVSGSAFWGWSNCPRYLAPGYSCYARVEFRPWHEGSFYGRLRFEFPYRGINVDLYGYGTRY